MKKEIIKKIITFSSLILSIILIICLSISLLLQKWKNHRVKKVEESFKTVLSLFPTENLEDFFNIEGPSGELNGVWEITESFENKKYHIYTVADIDQYRRTIKGEIKFSPLDNYDKGKNIRFIYKNGKFISNSKNKDVIKYFDNYSLFIQKININLKKYKAINAGRGYGAGPEFYSHYRNINDDSLDKIVSNKCGVKINSKTELSLKGEDEYGIDNPYLFRTIMIGDEYDDPIFDTPIEISVQYFDRQDFYDEDVIEEEILEWREEILKKYS